MKKCKEAWMPSAVLTTRLYNWINEKYKKDVEFGFSCICIFDNMFQANQIAYHAFIYDEKHIIKSIKYSIIENNKVELKITKKCR